MVAPLVDRVLKGSFMYIFGGLGLSSAVLSLLLKETKGVVMTDTANQQVQKSEAVSESVALE